MVHRELQCLSLACLDVFESSVVFSMPLYCVSLVYIAFISCFLPHIILFSLFLIYQVQTCNSDSDI